MPVHFLNKPRYTLREAIRNYNQLLFGFLKRALTPQTLPFFWTHSMTILKPDFILKFLKVFGLWSSSKTLLEKCPSQSQNCSSSSLESGRPPLSGKMSKCMQKSSSKVLESGNPTPLPEKFPNLRRKVIYLLLK